MNHDDRALAEFSCGLVPSLLRESAVLCRSCPAVETQELLHTSISEAKKCKTNLRAVVLGTRVYTPDVSAASALLHE